VNTYALNFLDAAVDKTPGVAGSYQDIDCSAIIPEGSPGVIIENIKINTAAQKMYCRYNGSTDDDYNNGANYQDHHCQGIGIVKVDANRVFEAKIQSTDCHVWVVGYVTNNVSLRDNRQAIDPDQTGSWRDKDLSTWVDVNSLGVIIQIVNANGSIADKGGIRRNGCTDDDNTNIGLNPTTGLIYAYCGVDANRVIEIWQGASTMHFYLLGFFKEGSGIVFKDNWVDKTPASNNAFVDSDLTGDTSPNAGAAIFRVKNTYTSANLKLACRKNGCTDDRSANSNLRLEQYSVGTHAYLMCGLDADNICELSTGNKTYAFFLLVGYADPLSATENINVNDSGTGTDTIASIEERVTVVSENGVGTETPAIAELLAAIHDSAIGTDIGSAEEHADFHEKGVGIEVAYIVQNTIGLDDVALPHVLNVDVEEPSIIQDLPIMDGLPYRKQLGKRGRSFRIQGWTDSLTTLETLRGYNDGEKHLLVLPTGDSMMVHVTDVLVPEDVVNYDRYDYTLVMVEVVD
jgi:hypothetical protein